MCALALSAADSQITTLNLEEEHLESVGCFLEYLYTGEYFPRKIASRELEVDPTMPAVDDNGEQLLKHARVYTLAQKLGLNVSFGYRRPTKLLS